MKIREEVKTAAKVAFYGGGLILSMYMGKKLTQAYNDYVIAPISEQLFSNLNEVFGKEDLIEAIKK